MCESYQLWGSEWPVKIHRLELDYNLSNWIPSINTHFGFWILFSFTMNTTNVPVNTLVTVKDGDDVLRVRGNISQTKTVTINQYGGSTYIHLRAPGGADGWNSVTLNVDKYKMMLRIVPEEGIDALNRTFQDQVCTIFVLFSVFKVRTAYIFLQQFACCGCITPYVDICTISKFSFTSKNKYFICKFLKVNDILP